ncbi:MAG: hypothetical protein QW041_00260 [Candidatus Pacearchaeota archaeon]
MTEEDIQDIIVGLRNALERGYNLEKAKLTFINAGYKKEDVEEAAKSFGEEKIKASLSAIQPRIEKFIKEKPLPEIPKIETKSQKKKNFIRIVIISVAAIIFLLIIFLLGVRYVLKTEIIKLPF